MKKMRIEKNIIFPEPVEKVVELKVSEGFTYQRNEDGIRAVGPLYIRGIYESEEEQHKFQEILEMDVLAPQEKLGVDGFYLEVGEFEAVPSSEGIYVEILLYIHGLAMTENTTAPKEVIDVEIPDDTMPSDIQKSANEETQPQSAPNVTVTEEPVEDVVAQDIDSIEDLFDDNENVYTSYRMVVAKPNDTYDSIAVRYDVDEAELRATNKDKEVCAKTLIVLPYSSGIKS